MEELRGEVGEVRGELTEAEMATAAIQGEVSALREELVTSEAAVLGSRQEVCSAHSSPLFSSLLIPLSHPLLIVFSSSSSPLLLLSSYSLLSPPRCPA